MLSGAYYILKYILGKVSTNRQHDLVDDMRRAFDNVEFEIVKKIICDNSGFDINTKKKKNSLVDKQRYKKFVISKIRCIFATD